MKSTKYKVKNKLFRAYLFFKKNKYFEFLIKQAQEYYQTFIATNKHLQNQLFQVIPFGIASAATGLIAYVYYKMFSLAERYSIHLLEQHNWAIFVITPLSFVLSWWIVKKYAPYARGSGIPQVMASIELATPKKKVWITYFLSFKIVVVKIVASVVKIFGGGILGREGPTIQIASSIFVEVYRFLPSWWQPIAQKNLLIAGAASGLAAAFNTPLGGIIFAIEELSKFHIRHFKSPLFIAVIIAGLTAQGLNGSYLYLGYPKLMPSGWMVYLGILVTAICSGYLGAKMAVYILKTLKLVASVRSNGKQLLMVLASAFLVATMVYFIGIDAMGSGKELMERCLFTEDKLVPWYVALSRMVGLVSTFSIGGAGGIFAPSLSSGASVGAFIAGLMQIGGSSANLLIVVGMTSFLTGVTRSPFTSAIIVFEMTDRHSVIFYLMLGAFLANVIASFVDKKSFYDHQKENYLLEIEEKISRQTS